MTSRLRRTELPQPQVFGLLEIRWRHIRQIEQEPKDTNADKMGFRKSERPNSPSPMSLVEVAARHGRFKFRKLWPVKAVGGNCLSSVRR